MTIQAAVFLVLSVLAPPRVQAAEKAVLVSLKSFACVAPPDWSVERKEGELYFTGPKGAEGLSARIAVRFFGPDQKLFKNAADYLQRQTGPGLFKVKGEKIGPVEKTTLAGHPAWRFSRESSEFVPPGVLHPKEVKVREEFVVVDRGRDFFVLSHYAPAGLFKKNRSVFKRILESFKPR